MRRFDPQKYTLARRRWWRSVEVGARLRVTHPGIYYGRIGAVITKSWDGAYVEVEAKRYRYFRMEDLEPT